MKRLLFLAALCASIAAAALGAAANARTGSTKSKTSASSQSIVLQAEDGQLATGRVEIVEQASFKSGKGVSLKPDQTATVDVPDAAPDVVFRVHAPKAGRYVVSTHAATDAIGRELMHKAKSKHESLFLKIAVGDARPTRRVVFVPWSSPESCTQTTGKFDLNDREQEIRIWLPKGVRLDLLDLKPYTPPQVPKRAASYRPPVVPTGPRPRLWMNQQSLPEVRANLTKGENAPIWEEVRKRAAKPCEFKATPGASVTYDSALETAAVSKAFVHLMTGDAVSGRQAVSLMRDYLGAVEFGNLLDVTREIGRAIYAGAQVYDWCYDLMTEEDRRSIRLNLMRLADDMEMGWPPFLEGVVNGHGSEAQLSCHLLSMAIAIYDEDPLPYQYCAYRVLEELVPMRKFEYQSPRHNQGIGYGIYRFGWDMHAAWLFYQMSGRKVFDPNIENVHKYWLYMRLPNGQSLPDGDGNADLRPTNLQATSLLTSAYAGDPIMKRDFLRQGGLPTDPILVLLLNDPDLKPADDFSSLPLTIDFGPVLGGMVARTGWKMGKGSSDVVVEMKGGGYHFGNHQHPDAGSFQIYYRGMQAADLGQYVFYGTPYDQNFNKRSISHNMMLVLDPDEKFGGGKLLNDGGARYRDSCPQTPEMARSNPRYANGTILSSDFGPSRQEPSFSYFSVNLTSAYSKKIRNYVRTFCFLNLEDKQTPAALIVLDNMETARPELKKYWQVNTLNPPETTGEGVILRNSDLGLSGTVALRMLRPAPAGRQMEILSGKDANSVFGQPLDPPKPDAPQARGHRIVFSPTTRQAKDVFLTVMTMSEEGVSSLPVELSETSGTFNLSMKDRVVVLSKTGKPLKDAFDVETTANGESQLLLTGLNPGDWGIRSQDGRIRLSALVGKSRNTAFFVVPKGLYTVEPTTQPH